MRRLSHRQEQIMAVLWASGPLTVQEIQKKMEDNLHYNTVSTVVRELEKNAFVTHVDRFKPYRYTPCIPKEEYLHKIIAELIELFFNNSIDGFLNDVSSLRKPVKPHARMNRRNRRDVSFDDS